MMQILYIIKRLFLKEKKKAKAGNILIMDLLKKLHFSSSIKRVKSQSSSDLIFDPIGLDEYIWIISKEKELFLSFLLDYVPKRQITYNMPKGKMSFRPVAYLHPVDSIVYQSIIDIIVRYKRNKFSKYVYSNIINDIDNNDVFHKPVLHWLEMRSNIRKVHKKGNDKYFFCDIAGYYENIKINKLLEKLDFFIGRNEVPYKAILKALLEKWQFASSQGLIQPHHASAILAKIYLVTGHLIQPPTGQLIRPGD